MQNKAAELSVSALSMLTGEFENVKSEKHQTQHSPKPDNKSTFQSFYWPVHSILFSTRGGSDLCIITGKSTSLHMKVKHGNVDNVFGR